MTLCSSNLVILVCALFGFLLLGTYPLQHLPITKGARVQLDRRDTRAHHAYTQVSFEQSPRITPVALTLFDTTRYQLDDEHAASDFSKLMPSGEHRVHIVRNNVAMVGTITMLHQLRCLDIIRQEYIIEPPAPPSSLFRHCINYLRQSFLCNISLRLEPTRSSRGQSFREYDTMCLDWTKVYDAAEENFRMYNVWRNGTSSI